MIGQVLDGRWALEALLGAGPTGAVYRARQLTGHGRAVAVKVLNPDAAKDPELVARFENESRAVAKLKHPSALKLIDSGATPGGGRYVVLEYVEGANIETLLAGGPIAPERLLGWMVQIAELLAEAHAAGIVHRNLKPTNVIIQTVAGKEIARVMDFGIARTGPATPGSYGTPGYMAPEVIRGEPSDGRADLYALGAIAYRCLAGRPVFDSPSLLATLKAHLEDPPPPLASGPPALRTLILDLLAKDPASRPTARTLVERLTPPARQEPPAIAHAPVEDRTATTGDEGRRTPRAVGDDRATTTGGEDRTANTDDERRRTHRVVGDERAATTGGEDRTATTADEGRRSHRAVGNERAAATGGEGRRSPRGVGEGGHRRGEGRGVWLRAVGSLGGVGIALGALVFALSPRPEGAALGGGARDAGLADAAVEAGPDAGAPRVDVARWLAAPGVRALAVDFHASWCAPCVAEAPRWKALRAQHPELRVVVVLTRDPGCPDPGWAPDEVACDPDGAIASALGAGESLPSASLWSWQGNLLASRTRVVAIEEALHRAKKRAPRVAVTTRGEVPALAVDEVRAALRAGDKLDVVATNEERAAIDELRRQSFSARYEEPCELGKDLTPNSLLELSVKERTLILKLLSAERACLVASAVVDVGQPREGVAHLLAALRTIPPKAP